MSHFLVQFPGDVAVFGRRCQFEILTVPVDLSGLCCFFSAENYCFEKGFQDFAISFDLLLK